MEIEVFFKNATVHFDGFVNPETVGEDALLYLYAMSTCDQKLWIELNVEYAPQAEDYTVIVRRFGLQQRSWAGSRLGCRDFAPGDDVRAMAFLKRVFLGDESAGIAPHRDSVLGPGRCIGVTARDGWFCIQERP